MLQIHHTIPASKDQNPVATWTIRSWLQLNVLLHSLYCSNTWYANSWLFFCDAYIQNISIFVLLRFSCFDHSNIITLYGKNLPHITHLINSLGCGKPWIGQSSSGSSAVDEQIQKSAGSQMCILIFFWLVFSTVCRSFEPQSLHLSFPLPGSASCKRARIHSNARWTWATR